MIDAFGVDLLTAGRENHLPPGVRQSGRGGIAPPYSSRLTNTADCAELGSRVPGAAFQLPELRRRHFGFAGMVVSAAATPVKSASQEGGVARAVVCLPSESVCLVQVSA